MRVRELADMPLRSDAPSAQQIWEGTLNIYKSVMPVLDQYDLRVGMHGNDRRSQRLMVFRRFFTTLMPLKSFLPKFLRRITV